MPKKWVWALGLGALGGVGGWFIYNKFIKPKIVKVKGLSVSKSKGGTVSVDLTLKNTGNKKHEFYCGCSIRHNDGTHVVDLKPKTATVSPGSTATVSWSTDTGCLTPTSGGPSSGETILDESGIYYDLRASVWKGATSNTSKCFDTELQNRLADTDWITKVIDTITIDASITDVTIEGTSVYP